MAVEAITLKCGHTIMIDLPDDTKLRTKIIENYHEQNCLMCRKKKQQALAAKKFDRMAEIKKLCEPLRHKNKKLQEKAEKIKEYKLSVLDDMFDKLTRQHDFSSDQEKIIFNHYRQRTILRFCRKSDADWWIEQQNTPVENIIDELKEKTFIIDGKIFRQPD